ncbi:MAG: TatD family hydrolase [Patescibacteria group bacterium]|nr:TatD family hydrolase [Patescibacteria group bacterium]
MTIKRIDIHAHLNFTAFDADRDVVARRALDAGTAFINVGTQYDMSRKAVDIAEKYDGVYAIIGLHPIHTSASFHDNEELGDNGNANASGFTSRGEDFDADRYRELIKHPKVVGVGEVGLDYYRSNAEPAAKARQKAAFEAQIDLANEFNKPLMLHIREAYDDALEILKSRAEVKGNAHFFAGTVEQARRFLDIGFTLSFTGVITFAKQYAELVEYVPLDMMHAETDCPFVAPVPHRGERNEPSYVSAVVEKIAMIKKLPVETVEAALLRNAGRVFGICGLSSS